MGTLKELAELPDVNISTGARSSNTERTSLKFREWLCAPPSAFIDRSVHVTSLPPCWRTITKDSSSASIVSSTNIAATSLSFDSLGSDCKPSIDMLSSLLCTYSTILVFWCDYSLESSFAKFCWNLSGCIESVFSYWIQVCLSTYSTFWSGHRSCGAVRFLCVAVTICSFVIVVVVFGIVHVPLYPGCQRFSKRRAVKRR